MNFGRKKIDAPILASPKPAWAAGEPMTGLNKRPGGGAGDSNKLVAIAAAALLGVAGVAYFITAQDTIGSGLAEERQAEAQKAKPAKRPGDKLMAKKGNHANP